MSEKDRRYTSGAVVALCTLLLSALAGPAHAATINGRIGVDDLIFGTRDNDVLNGGAGAGNDIMFGKQGNDQLNGGDGADRSFGGTGTDTLNTTGNGAWFIDDSASGDTTNANGPNNLIFSADGGVDLINCGANPSANAFVDANDSVNGSCETLSTNGSIGGFVAKFGGSGADTLNGSASIAEILFGKGGPDRLSGGAGPDILLGGTGRDLLRGGGGADTLIDDGGSNDVLKGGGGKDTLYSADGKADTVNCGDGNDKAYIDRSDETIGCEKKFKRTDIT